MYHKYCFEDDIDQLREEMSDKDARVADAIESAVSDQFALMDKIGVSVKPYNGGVVLPYVVANVHGDEANIYFEAWAPNLQLLMKEETKIAITGVLARAKIPFSVVSGETTEDGQYVRFELETSKEQRFYIRDGRYPLLLGEDAHSIQLDHKIKWTPKDPHFQIVGRTNSGKTEFVQYLLRVAELQGWHVEIHSLKPDGLIYRYEGLTDAKSIVERLEEVVEIMKDRQLKMQAYFKDRMEVDYRDFGLNDYMVVLDEMALLNDAVSGSDKESKDLKGRLDAALSTLIRGYRAAGLRFVGIGQYGSAETFKPAYARSMTAKLMLGNSTGLERSFIFPAYEDDGRKFGMAEGLIQLEGSGPKYQTPYPFKAPWFEH